MKTKEEAAAWLLKLEGSEVPRPEREAFVEWLRESPVHVAEVLRMTNVHESLQRFQLWNEVDTHAPQQHANVIDWNDVEPRSREEHAPQRSPYRGRLLSAIAAGVIAVVVSGFWLIPTLLGDTIQTERGERREVILSDGSLVQVDPETKLRVKLKAHARDIVLERGRAVFRVAKNPARPFSVRAEDTIVRAVGTAFGVERRKSGIKVTVAEGKVAIINSGATRSEPLLTANEQIIVAPSGAAEAVRKVDSTRELAWARGRLAFERETLATVVDDFNRYNQVQLRVADADLATRPVSGVFDAADTESFIAFVQSAINAKIVRVDEETVVIASSE